MDEAKLRRGISDVFRNLAKRNQSLLHRQMALLDVLERREEDPGNLDSLYRIDHLTTRMRRHAESLVVLAGDAPKRGWRRPVPFVDVLRAAASEVEDYTRIKVITSTRASLAGPAVADVIHLIAELAENATVYSPRDNQVRIVGELVAHGFAIEIEDRGLGLDDEELALLNGRLADPPLFDLSGSDQLGIFVAAQLAKRHGISASLTRSPYGGVTAVVLIPMSLVVDPDAAGPPGDHEDAVPLVPGDRHALVARAVPATGPSGPLTATGSSGPLTAIARPGALVSASAERPAGAHRERPAGDPPGRVAVAAEEQPLPGGPGTTENGLPIRVRRASLAPQLQETGIPGAAAGGGPAARDPEVARAVMSAFHHGWRRGLADPGEAPDPAQGGAQDR